MHDIMTKTMFQKLNVIEEGNLLNRLLSSWPRMCETFQISTAVTKYRTIFTLFSYLYRQPTRLDTISPPIII